MEKQTNGQMNRQVDEWDLDDHIDGCMTGWMDVQTNGLTNRRTKG